MHMKCRPTSPPIINAESILENGIDESFAAPSVTTFTKNAERNGTLAKALLGGLLDPRCPVTAT